MVELGYALSSEELPARPRRHARRAEEAGFGFALVSDHFHPGSTRRARARFVWSILGAIARRPTPGVGHGRDLPDDADPSGDRRAGRGDDRAPHPGRFFLGVGTGENLNEHVLGDRWPSHEERLRCSRRRSA